MTTFENGPAAGVVLQLQGAPDFLRVVVKGEPEQWDALDLEGDGPESEETIYCYQRKGEAGVAFVDGSSKGRRWGMRLAIATYSMCLKAPPEDIMRDNDRWRNWCQDQAIDLGDKSMPKAKTSDQDWSVPFRGTDLSEHKDTTKWFDIVGGKLDGRQHPVDHPKEMPTTFILDGESYVALQFKRDENKPQEVIIFMIADDTMSPAAAMKIWRDRYMPPNEKPAAENKLNETAKKLAEATVAQITKVGPEKYCELAEAMLERVSKEAVFVGRGRIMIELATKIADVRANPAKYRTKEKPEAGSAKPKEAAPAPPPKPPPARKPLTPEESAHTMGAIKPPVDPDDEPW